MEAHASQLDAAGAAAELDRVGSVLDLRLRVQQLEAAARRAEPTLKPESERKYC